MFRRTIRSIGSATAILVAAFMAASYRDMFVPMLGFITAVTATLVAILTAIFGPFKKLRLPIESVPGMSRGVLNIVLFAPFVACFLLVDPFNARHALILSLLTLPCAFVCYQMLGKRLNQHRFNKPRARRFLWFKWNRDEVVIGGTSLTPRAAERKRRTGANEQKLLAEAEYNADEIWERPGRARSQACIERWYYGFMLFSLLSVVLASLAGQALLSAEAPASIAKRVWAKVSSK